MRKLRPREGKITFSNQRTVMLEFKPELCVWPQHQVASSLLPAHTFANWHPQFMIYMYETLGMTTQTSSGSLCPHWLYDVYLLHDKLISLSRQSFFSVTATFYHLCIPHRAGQITFLSSKL